MTNDKWIYDPEDWEYTCYWTDRNDLADELRPETVKRFCTLLPGPDAFAATVPVSWTDGEADDWEIQWFDTEADAIAATKRTHP